MLTYDFMHKTLVFSNVYCNIIELTWGVLYK